MPHSWVFGFFSKPSTLRGKVHKQHCVEAGSGPPVVLLHGFPETWYAWRHQIPALRQRHRQIVPDLRGYGATEKPAAGYDKRTGALEGYRAGEEDVEQDQADVGVKLACPTLALRGEEFESGGKTWDFPAIWRELADDLTTVSVPLRGHLPHEERPDVVNPALLRFLEGWTG